MKSKQKFTYTPHHHGQALKKFIQEKGLTNEALGRRLGLQSFSITRIYRSATIGPPRLRTFSELLGVDLCEWHLSDQTREILAAARKVWDPETKQLHTDREQATQLQELREEQTAQSDERRSLEAERIALQDQLQAEASAHEKALAALRAEGEAALAAMEKKMEALKEELTEAKTQVRVLEGKLDILLPLQKKLTEE